MRYGILGTTQALRDDGTAVALGGARLRSLLAALALRPGRTRAAEALIDEIWEAEPPADAPGALQALVGRLRRALGHDAVESADGGGYRLRAAADDIDLYRFERLADEGARALADGDPHKAAVLLDDALRLWRGPALADLPDPGAAAARCDARRLDARRARLAADLALGRAEAALPALVELCAEHPLDEPLHALRLRALHAAGRTAEALTAYEELRAGLADRLGVDPGGELRAVHAELLEPAGAPEPPRRPAPAPATGNLRARRTSFVGRESDLDTIRTDLGAHRLVTLLGPGGAGKTRLSQEAADSLKATWPDGVWVAELAPLDDGATVPEAVLTALGARETLVRTTATEGLRASDPSALDPLTRLAEHCAPRRMLLLLDNCEHVIDAAAGVAETLLASCPDVSVLATSREPLAVPGELVRPVEPLPDPVALRLLADRGAAARPGFSTDDDPEACAEICRRLDGLPLAIELAAARLRMLTPRGLADRLDDRFRLLTSGSRTVLPRQQTLRAVVDWSWDLLDGPERAVLRRLSVFAGGCALDEAEAVCADDEEGAGGGTGGGQGTGADGRTGGGERTGSGARTGGRAGVATRDVAVLLGSLVDKSLVVAATPSADAGGEMRYRLLETVGEYAAERLDEAGERAAVERRHLVAYRELARTADPLLRGPAQRVWLERLELEHDNMRTALRRAVAAGDEQEALCLVLSLSWFWQLRDHRVDACTWGQAAAELGPDPFAAPVTPAPPLPARCIDAPPPMDAEQLQEARREVRLVVLSSMESNIDPSASAETRAQMSGITAAYRPGLPQTCRVPGFSWIFAVLLTSDGDMPRLKDVIHATVESCREFGYEWELAHALQMRSKFLNDQGDGAAQATRDADESLEIFLRLGDGWGVSEALAGRAEAREQRGEFALAADDYRKAVERYEELGAHGQVPLLRARLAEVLMESGAISTEEGERLLRETLTSWKGANRDVGAFARLQLAVRIARAGRTDEARTEFDRLYQDFEDHTIHVFQGMVVGLYGWLEVLEGRPGAALAKLRQALAKTRTPLGRLIAPHLPLTQILTGAQAHALLGRDREAEALCAARLLGAHNALRPPGHARSEEREARAAAEAMARAVLSGPAYERAYAEGGALSLEEAAALV
ncbi:BTAD domain-containing putative transcriptional regulator [Streptomyces varsoviensis]|uniref:BTAD domain-containing putative transcriptional regulator n=1 Tax=Streptomyces varsoviensis TaxID=67373 RepID=UPI0033C47F9E